jgi:uncharacterized protein involved in exopolysaccharide biosynthesis
MKIEELFTYWKVVKKRLWLIGLLMVITLGVMLIRSYLSDPLYKSSATFQVTTPLPTDVSLFSEEFRTSTSRAELGFTKNNFLEVLKSEFVIGQVLEEFELEADPVDLLGERIVIELIEGSDLVELTVFAEKPDQAAAIANTLLDVASHSFAELNAGSLTANREFIQRQIQDVKEERDGVKAALVQFQIENKVGDLDAFLERQQALIVNLKLRRDDALASGDQVALVTYDEAIAARERELQDLILLRVDYDELQEQVRGIQRTYTGLLDKQIEAELKENSVLSAKFIRVIPAHEPKHPLPRYNSRLLMVGAIVSFTVGIILSFLLEALSNVSIQTGNDTTLKQERVLSSRV